jgi:cell division septum initiation protein DivIVA
MANSLEFLRGLLTEADQQQRFEDDPATYVTSSGFPDLSGEDVAEAIRVLVRTLPPQTGGRLAPYARDDGDVPAVRPQVGETEFDAAIRQLRFAVFLSPAATPTDQDQEQEPEQESVPHFTEVAPAEPEPPTEAVAEPVAMHSEVDSPTPVRAVAASGALDPYSAFGDEMASIIRHAGDQMNAVMSRAEIRADAAMREAEQDAQSTRDSAQSEAQTIRDTARQEAEVILRDAKSTREQADAALMQARGAQDEAVQEARELVQKAERDANVMLAEARARRDEIRAAEQELRKRLEGVNSVFESLGESTVPDEI